MEIWDAYYKDGTPAGCNLVRGEPIPVGLYHLVSEIVVRHTDGDFLIMQRDYNKPIEPGKFEVTAGGSVQKGETALVGAYRELFEETGIKTDKLSFVFAEISEEKQTIYRQFICITDCDKNSITLQEGETVSFKWLSLNDLMKSLKEFPKLYCGCTAERLSRYNLFSDNRA